MVSALMALEKGALDKATIELMVYARFADQRLRLLPGHARQSAA
jgi:hypothetical protein